MDRSTDAPRPRPESPEQARPVLQAWGVRDADRGWLNLARIAAAVGADGLDALLPALGRHLPRCPDPDMGLNNLERFLDRPAGAAQLSTLLEARGRVLEILLQLFATSQYFSDLLIAHPEDTDMLRVPLRRSPSLRELQDQLRAATDAAFEDSAVLRAFRRFRQRQTLRIGANDIIRERPLEEVTRDISRVADASLEVALAVALRQTADRFGRPFTAAGAPARCVVLAFGKLGGEELNYSSDIDLMFLYDEEGATRGRRGAGIGNDDFFARVTGAVVRLLSAHTDEGQAYRVDLRLRPEGHRGALARSLDSTLGYYDKLGRTWERQALIKLRAVAGDRALGDGFRAAIEPFIYRKYLSAAEIHEIKVLKRRIEQKAGRAGGEDTDVKTGRGGIRDIEFTIQFLQLLNGSDLPEVRQRNTLLAMLALERAGCLTDQEYQILDDAYRYLRKTEHRLQLLFGLQTHRLPAGDDELRKLALRMGYGKAPSARAEPPSADERQAALAAFRRDYREKTDLDRKILDHLLHQTFEGEGGQAEPEADLILDPHPDDETVRAVLGRYPFRDVPGAFANLSQLATESVPFLSARRCRHFLASIAPQLLRALAETPDPDTALVNLEKVTASLGAKSVLWELFSFNPPTLRLYVHLCAGSEFLSEILINNPGMIDELLDSLVLNQPRTLAELRAELAELCRGAQDPEPILHSFQGKELLRIGVRDLLGKSTVRETTAALTDLAEAILPQVVMLQEPPLQSRFGVPTSGTTDPRPCRYVLLGLGKLGAREMTYQSDLDLVLVYEDEGRTRAGAASAPPAESLDNGEYFTELAQRVIRAVGTLGPLGRLYAVDMRLRPMGKSGSLVIPLAEFRRYYADGGAQLWERQALTRARVVHGDADFGRQVMEAVEQAVYSAPWRREWADEVRAMRERIEAAQSGRDLKRGAGGIVDVEFLVQLCKLKYAGRRPGLRNPNTWASLEALHAEGMLAADDYAALRQGYDFLRQVESRLRIAQNRSLDELPARPEELEKLARRLGWEAVEGTPAGARFAAQLEYHTRRIRETFLRLVRRERDEIPPGG